MPLQKLVCEGPFRSEDMVTATRHSGSTVLFKMCCAIENQGDGGDVVLCFSHLSPEAIDWDRLLSERETTAAALSAGRGVSSRLQPLDGKLIGKTHLQDANIVGIHYEPS